MRALRCELLLVGCGLWTSRWLLRGAITMLLLVLRLQHSGCRGSRRAVAGVCGAIALLLLLLVSLLCVQQGMQAVKLVRESQLLLEEKRLSQRLDPRACSTVCTRE